MLFCFSSQGHHFDFSPESAIKRQNQIEHVSTKGDVIHDRTRFTSSEYLVWLVITQWIASPVDKGAIWFGFLSHIFEDIWREVVVSLGASYFQLGVQTNETISK